MPPEDVSGEGFRIRDRRGQPAETGPGGPGFDPPRRSDEPPSREHTETSPPGRSDLPPEPDLAALFLLLANSALLNLGETPEAPVGVASMDLTQAKFSIDLLRLLKEKTEGNRSPDESRLLDGMLYDLQLRFVRAVGPR